MSRPRVQTLVITSWLEADGAGGHSIFRIRSRREGEDREVVSTVTSPARALDIVRKWLDGATCLTAPDESG